MQHETSVLCGTTPKGRRAHTREYSGQMIVEDVEVAQQVVEIPPEELEQALVPALHGEPEEVFPEHRQHVVILHTWNVTSQNV